MSALKRLKAELGCRLGCHTHSYPESHIGSIGDRAALSNIRCD